GLPAIDPSTGITITSAENPLAESEWALRSIRRALEEGIDPKALAIYIQAPERYAGLLTAAAARQGISLVFPRRTPLLHTPWQRFL
ncbi:hypothetical protein, partial [Enterococcus faecium]